MDRFLENLILLLFLFHLIKFVLIVVHIVVIVILVADLFRDSRGMNLNPEQYSYYLSVSQSQSLDYQIENRIKLSYFQLHLASQIVSKLSST